MNSPRFQVKKKDIGAFGPDPSAEFRGGSCCASHFAWIYHICKILPGGVEAHSKAPIREIQSQGLKYILFFMTEDPEIMPGIHCLKIDGPGIIPRSTLSKN